MVGKLSVAPTPHIFSEYFHPRNSLRNSLPPGSTPGPPGTPGAPWRPRSPGSRARPGPPPASVAAPRPPTPVRRVGTSWKENGGNKHCWVKRDGQKLGKSGNMLGKSGKMLDKSIGTC